MLFQDDLIFKNESRIKAGTFFCIGQNYSKHALEMGGTVPSEPTVFLKPANSLVLNGGEVNYPIISENLHFEVELVIVIAEDCYRVSEHDARKYIAGYGVGIDFTMRDKQKEFKNKGLPWAISKGFYRSAPISNIEAMGDTVDFNSLSIELFQNGEIKQNGLIKEMDKSVEFLLSYLSGIFGLRKGDVIFTGTPEGVGPVKIGDEITAKLKSKSEIISELSVKIV